MAQRTVLIVTYYWPPAGGPGVQRIYFFAKYLIKLNWNVAVYTIKNNQQLGIDNSRIDLGITTYYGSSPLFSREGSGKSFSDSKEFIGLIKRWIRGNLFIPDSKIFWLFKCNSDVAQILNRQKVDICLVTGPPQTTHLVGYKIRKKYKIPTVHDFRDPWTNAYFLSDFMRSGIANKIDRFFEKKVIDSASGLVTVSNQLTYLFTSRQSDFLIIPNGFEGDIKAEKKNKHNLMIYTGTVALSQIADGFYEHLSDFGLKLNFYGDVHNQLTRLVLDKQLSDHIKFHHRVNHSQLSSIHDDADYFLLLIPNTTNNGGILTGKVFEYMAANRPIFAIGPTSGDCAEILYESGIGKMYDYATDFRMALRDFLSIDFKINHKYVERFQRSKQAQQLSAYLERIASLD